MSKREPRVEIKDVIRWETRCCGFAFNTTARGEPFPEEPTTVHVYGVGSFLNGRCGGCGTGNPRIDQLGGDIP